MSTTFDPRIGTELAGYRLDELLGRGGMGVVYRARDLALERDVALKLLAPDLAEDVSFRERFLRESRLAASIEHPNVVPIHDAGEIDGQLYIAMRLVEGTDLKALLQDGPLAPAQGVGIVDQVAGALDAAHARGLVHRDVKPSNVLIDGQGHVYLADFGLSRRLGDAAAPLGATASLGTADYVAPEQIRGDEVDGRADLYSLGCLLYECLTGEPPFRRPSEVATLFAHLEEAPPAPPQLDEVMRTALAKEPDERFQSGRELAQATRAALGLEPKRVRWPLAVAAVGLALIGAALLAFFLTSDNGGSPPAAQGGRLIRIDPESNRVTNSFAVGDGGEGVAAGGGTVWVASYRDGSGSLWLLEPGTDALTKLASVGRPFDVALQGGHAYVAAVGPGQFSGNVSQYSVSTGGREDGVEVLGCSLTSGPYGVWVTGCPNVQKLNTEGTRLRIGRTVVIPFAKPLSAANTRESLPDMAEGEGAIWVIGDAADRRLWRIDPRRFRIAATIPLGFPPGSVVAGGGGVWVSDQLGDRLVRIDPATNRVAASIPVGRGAAGVAFGAGSVWVAGSIDHTVTRVDPISNRAIETISLDASPRAIAVGEGGVWVVGDAR